MALTLMPLATHSFDKALVSCATPPLDAAYAGTVMPPWNESKEATLMTEPRRPLGNSDASRDSRLAPNSRASVKTDVRLILMTLTSVSE